MANKKETPAKPRRRRAKNPDGTFKANNPNTPENEAWEPVEAEPKKTAGKYSVKKKITGTSEGQETAGKYANNKEEKVNPTFTGIKTIYH
tara:strand:- start:1345 stop:1614 length:270 start_codon:yes stop_codon:yes gene_type:complete